MKVIIRQFLGLNHSWSVVGQNIARSLIKLGHSVDLFSTNGIKYFPDDLRPNLIGYVEENNTKLNNKYPDNLYDMSISYTCMKNFGSYLSHSKKNRFGIWCYEFANKGSLPDGFAKHHVYADKILAPSNFSRNVFLENKVPEDKVITLTHGINIQEITSCQQYPLKTKKSIKILINLGQIHKRKGLGISLDMFGKAFTNKDDVCLVLKIQDRPPKQIFELSFSDIFRKFKEKYPNHAEVEIIREFIPNIYSLYKSCDITLAASHCEGFGLVPFEGLACGLIPVASNYGSFLDFLTPENSLLIDGKEINVPPDWLYYQSKTGTKAFMPNIDHGVEQLRKSIYNFDNLNKIAKSNSEEFCKKYSWDVVAQKIIDISI